MGAEMSKVFHCFPDLVELHLKNCALDNDRVSNLVVGLQHLTNLEKLYLQGNNGIDSAGWAELAKALESLQALTFLDLSRCELVGTNLEALASGLGNLHSLRDLDLSWNRQLKDTQGRKEVLIGWRTLKDELEKLEGLRNLMVLGCHRQADEVLQ